MHSAGNFLTRWIIQSTVGALFLTGKYLMFCPAISAETRTIAGLPLEFDSLTEVDSKNSRLTVDGKILLVPTEEADGALLQYTLKSPTALRKISVEALLDFVNSAVKQKNEGWTELGAFALAHHPQLSDQLLAELFVAVEGNQSALRGFKAFVDDKSEFSARSPRMRSVFLLEIGIGDIDWFRGHALAVAISLKNDFRAAAKKAVSEAVQTRRFARLPALAALLREVLGVEDQQFQETKLVSEQLLQFQRGLEAQDSALLEIVLVTLKSNQELESQIFPYLVDELHRAVRARLDSDQVVPALRLLSLVDLTYRTTTTHTLLKLSIDRLDGKDLGILSDSNVRRFIFSLAQFDAGLRKNTERRLEELFYQALESGNLTQVDRALDDILIVRPDPSDKNDELRINYARALRMSGMYEQGEIQLSAVKLGIPLNTRLKILAEDSLGVSLSTMILEFLAMFLIVVILLNRLRRASQIIKEKQAKREEFEKTRAEEERPRGSTVEGPVFRRIDKISPERSEYNRLLMILGVSPNARFKEIRSAYRKAVKTHHPDMQGAGLANDKFVDLNQTYERVLQLREMMGLSEND